jgi:hypothetical protein
VVGSAEDIELKIPTPFRNYADVVGSAEGFGTIFVSTDDGLFTIELKSGRKRKVGEWGNYFVTFPFTSFYTPGIYTFAQSDLQISTVECK